MLNLQIAKAYLAGTDSGVATRTWQNALDVLAASKHGDNERRWRSASNDPAFDLLRHQVIIETRGETLLRLLRNRFHKHLPAATSQLLFGHELASLADHSETPVASIQVQGETRRHLGGGTRRL